MKRSTVLQEKTIIDETTDWPSTTVKTTHSQSQAAQHQTYQKQNTAPRTHKNSNYYSFFNSET